MNEQNAYGREQYNDDMQFKKLLRKLVSIAINKQGRAVTSLDIAKNVYDIAADFMNAKGPFRNRKEPIAMPNVPKAPEKLKYSSIEFGKATRVPMEEWTDRSFKNQPKRWSKTMNKPLTEFKETQKDKKIDFTNAMLRFGTKNFNANDKK